MEGELEGVETGQNWQEVEDGWKVGGNLGRRQSEVTK